jgi:hypothetical protein
LPPDVTSLLDALRENENLMSRIDNFEKLLDRAERELEEERKALEDNKLSFRDYLTNLYVMYLKWLVDETSASTSTARLLTFCVARHLNETPLIAADSDSGRHSVGGGFKALVSHGH